MDKILYSCEFSIPFTLIFVLEDPKVGVGAVIWAERKQVSKTFGTKTSYFDFVYLKTLFFHYL